MVNFLWGITDPVFGNRLEIFNSFYVIRLRLALSVEALHKPQGYTANRLERGDGAVT